MSAGLAAESDSPLDAEMLEWADRIFVMENRHRKAIERRFPRYLRKGPVVVLAIPDDYGFMDEQLITLLRARMRPYLP